MPVQFILLIDDDADDQFVFESALHSIDMSVTLETATDGLAALQKLDTVPTLPELIFVDLNMPRMDGISFLREVKSSDKYAGIPIIVYSTSSSLSDIEETKHLGASQFITKPNNYGELCRLLAIALRSYS